MEYMQKEIKAILEEKKSPIKIKIITDELQTKWMVITPEVLTALYNNLYY